MVFHSLESPQTLAVCSQTSITLGRTRSNLGLPPLRQGYPAQLTVYGACGSQGALHQKHLRHAPAQTSLSQAGKRLLPEGAFVRALSLVPVPPPSGQGNVGLKWLVRLKSQRTRPDLPLMQFTAGLSPYPSPRTHLGLPWRGRRGSRHSSKGLCATTLHIGDPGYHGGDLVPRNSGNMRFSLTKSERRKNLVWLYMNPQRTPYIRRERYAHKTLKSLPIELSPVLIGFRQQTVRRYKALQQAP